MAKIQPDLFAEPALPGFTQRREFVAADEARALIAAIGREQLAPFRYRGWIGKRLTASFGWRYDFDTGRLEPAGPMPDWLRPLRERVARCARLAPDALAQALLIRYDPGAGIGWHSDRPEFGQVLGVSLGAAATMRFRRKRPRGFDRYSAELDAGSLYHLSGEARHGWEHSIAPVECVRWSITFRCVAVQGRTP